MSQRYAFASRCIEDLLLLGDVPKNIWVADRPVLDQVHGTRKQRGKGVAKAKIVLHPDGNGHRLELHKEVRIAANRVEVLPENGAECRQPTHLIALAQGGDFFEVGVDWILHDGSRSRIAPDCSVSLTIRLVGSANEAGICEPRFPTALAPGYDVAPMFPYDPTLLAAVQTAPQSVPDVIQILQTIEATCMDGDGLKWFNGLYLDVTQAVESRVTAGGFVDPAWLSALDVQFASLYFAALKSSLSGAPTPGCWQALFNQRGQAAIARIQFALAGVNAHINHDLPQAIVATCKALAFPPQHGTAQYNDYTALNTTLDSLIEAAKITLNVRLLGDALPPASSLENTLAAWSVAAARESAWNNAELLWHLADEQVIAATFLDTLDGLTAVASKTLLVPVP